MNGIIDNWGDIVVLSYLIPLLLFIGLYLFRSPWTSTELGIALMFQKVGMSLIVLLIVASIYLGDYPYRDLVRGIIYTAVGVALWVDVVNLLRYQRKTRASSPDEVTHPPKIRFRK